jgi:hypothetical protein
MRTQLMRRLSLLAAASILSFAGGFLGVTAVSAPAQAPLAAAPAPAAAHLTASQSTANAPAVAVPDVYKWLYYATYSTQHACLVAGSYQTLYVNSGYIYKCVEYTEGDYFVWELYLGIPT